MLLITSWVLIYLITRQWKSLSHIRVFVTLYSPWDSLGQNTGVGSLSRLQRIFPTQVSCIAGGFFTSWATTEAQEYWSVWLIPSPAYFPNPGIEPGSSAVQANSLPTEIPGKTKIVYIMCCAVLSHFQLFVIPWTVVNQAPLPMGILQARILEWVAMPSSKGIFPTQGLSPGLWHCRQILYHLSY